MNNPTLQRISQHKMLIALRLRTLHLDVDFLRFQSEYLACSLEPADTAGRANMFLRIPDRQPALEAGLTRTLGLSGGTSDTMLWLGMSLLVVAGRFPPALLDMSKADLISG